MKKICAFFMVIGIIGVIGFSIRVGIGVYAGIQTAKEAIHSEKQMVVDEDGNLYITGGEEL